MQPCFYYYRSHSSSNFLLSVLNIFPDTSQCTVANVEESKWTRFITSSLKLENDSDDDSEMKLSEVRNISAVTLDRDEWLGNKKRRVQKRRNEREDQTSANVFQRKRKNIFSASENVLGRIGIPKSYPDFMKQPKIYESLTQPVDNVKTTEEDKGNTASSTSGNSVLCEDKKLPEEDRHISKWDRFRSDEHGSSEEEDDHESLVFT